MLDYFLEFFMLENAIIDILFLNLVKKRDLVRLQGNVIFFVRKEKIFFFGK